jgi:hypothetical protein
MIGLATTDTIMSAPSFTDDLPTFKTSFDENEQ